MTEKVFVKADDLVRDSFDLARSIYDSGFIPDVLLVLWRGGTPVGVVIHEFLLYKGIDTYHTVIKSESYTGVDQRREPQLECVAHVLEHVTASSKVLVVDDIFDSGSTMQKVVGELLPRVAEIKIATLYYKRDANVTDLTPDFFHRETDRWIVFPHELMGLTSDEIRAKDPSVADLTM